MPIVRELDPQVHLKLVEGYTDVLAAEKKTLEAFYRLHEKCKRCGRPMQKEYDGRVAFNHDDLLPHALLKCTNCGFLLEPFSGVILHSGNPAKIPTDKHYF